MSDSVSEEEDKDQAPPAHSKAAAKGESECKERWQEVATVKCYDILAKLLNLLVSKLSNLWPNMRMHLVRSPLTWWGARLGEFLSDSKVMARECAKGHTAPYRLSPFGHLHTYIAAPTLVGNNKLLSFFSHGFVPSRSETLQIPVSSSHQFLAHYQGFGEDQLIC